MSIDSISFFSNHSSTRPIDLLTSKKFLTHHKSMLYLKEHVVFREHIQLPKQMIRMPFIPIDVHQLSPSIVRQVCSTQSISYRGSCTFVEIPKITIPPLTTITTTTATRPTTTTTTTTTTKITVKITEPVSKSTANSFVFGRDPIDLAALSLLLAEHHQQNLSFALLQGQNQHKSLFSDDDARKNKANQQFSARLPFHFLIFSSLYILF